MTKISINCKIEELPVIIQFTIDTFNRDKTDLKPYKPLRYIATYAGDLLALKTTVEGIVNPKQSTAQLKVITGNIISDTLLLRPKLDRLEGYLNDAVGLSIGKKDFGISQVRQKISNGDQEGLNGALLYLLGNLDAGNMAILTPLGLLPADKTAFETLRTQIAANNAAQNVKIDERANLVVTNFSVLDGAAKVVKAQWADGKALYKTSNKTKLNDYVNAQIINRIRQEELKTKIAGLVKNATGPEKNAKVVAKPVLGGRGKTVYTNATGNYELKGLKPGSYNITVTTTGGAIVNVQADAVTSTTVTAPIVMIP